MELTTLVKTTFSVLLVASTRLLVFTSICMVSVQAATYSETITWDGGMASGSTAATCTYTIPDNMPLSAPRTIVVDNAVSHTDNILITWGYNEFQPNYTISCIGSGIRNTYPQIKFNDGHRDSVIQLTILGPSQYPMPTNNNGIDIKLYVMYAQDAAVCDSCIGDYLGNGTKYKITNGQQYNINGFVESDMKQARITIPILIFSDGKYGFESNRATSGAFSIRGELIKNSISVVKYDSASTPIVFKSGWNNSYLIAGPGSKSNVNPGVLFGSGGVNIVPPTCRFKTKDNIITMPMWVALGANTRAPGHTLPASGSPFRVDLPIECSGQLRNVYLKFEDAGTNILSSENISLYDAGDSSKIDGLEIELLQFGNHIPIDNTTKIDLGIRGETKGQTTDGTIFNSESTVLFTARYIQTAAITKNGNAYTGPVTGKVNVWVTYN